ncbi:HAD-IIB family hydrolase [Sphingomonas floccifaciens]|uniref:sucrose-phosphate synthase n=1 Tax=Sphingomonas floccifaciens TaxID=1844115 RepID=A0ABW4N7X6_9SPHN
MSLALGGCIKGPPVAFGLTEDTGGHITYALGAAQALAARDDVTVVEIVTRLIDDPALGPAYSQPYEPISDKLAIRRIDTGTRAYLSKEANAADRPAFIAALIRHIETSRHRPDIIHAHFADAAEVAAAVRDRFGIPFIYTAHSLGIDKAASCGSGDLDSRIAHEARAIAQADAIIASSRDEAERQLMLYPGASPARIHCVPPGAALTADGAPDIDGAAALVAPFLRDPAKPMLLAIARPVLKKNLAALIDLYAADVDLRRRCNLVIVAGLRDGPDSGEAEQRRVVGSLLERLDRHDLYGSLALPKRHGAGEIAGLYALAAATGGVFVNPALTEPYGLTLTEAATHGLPVVATIHGGPADIVARLGHGVVADPNDPACFADAIRRLIVDRTAWQAASDNGRERSRDLGWPTYATRFVGIARAVIERVRRPAAMIARPVFDDLLLSDIDHTLTGCATGATALCELLKRRQTLGFGVATGRSLQEAQRLLAEWRYPDPDLLITSVGSEIYWREGRCLSADDGFAAHIAEGWRPRAVASALESLADLVPQPPVDQRRFKLSYFADSEAVAARVRDRLATAGIAARVIYSHGRLLDVLPERAGKGAAMAWAARRLGLPLTKVHAAGDSGNDLDMLEACPNAIVVANHEPALTALRAGGRAYFAQRPYAGGVVEALDRRFGGVSA